MRFSVIVPVLAATASAAAVSPRAAAAPTRQDVLDAANILYANAAAAGCDWLSCISSLAGETAACAAAAAEAAVNVIADIACIASVGSSTAACRNCP